MESKNIKVKKDTYIRLDSLGKRKETFDELLNRVLDDLEAK